MISFHKNDDIFFSKVIPIADKHGISIFYYRRLLNWEVVCEVDNWWKILINVDSILPDSWYFDWKGK